MVGTLSTCLLAVLLIAGSGARAALPPDPPTNAQEAAATDPAAADPAGPYSIELKLDYTTAYFFRGFNQEDTGLILQPGTEFSARVFAQDDVEIAALLGIWSSFHGQKTGAQDSGDASAYWFENDLLGGVTLTRGILSFSTYYVWYTAPSNAFTTIEEINFLLEFDDSQFFESFAFHPYALVAGETTEQATDGIDAGWYLEIGLAPEFSVGVSQTPVTISFPTAVGFSLGDYYQDENGDDETFGFAQAGVKVSIPLPFNESCGQWSINAGVNALFLGDHVAVLNDGDNQQLIGFVGLQFNF